MSNINRASRSFMHVTNNTGTGTGTGTTKKRQKRQLTFAWIAVALVILQVAKQLTVDKPRNTQAQQPGLSLFEAPEKTVTLPKNNNAATATKESIPVQRREEETAEESEDEEATTEEEEEENADNNTENEDEEAKSEDDEDEEDEEVEDADNVSEKETEDGEESNEEATRNDEGTENRKEKENNKDNTSENEQSTKHKESDKEDKLKGDESTSKSIKAGKADIVMGDSGPAQDITSTKIRSWGCARNETPFIFVHIGKAGGGGVRSRMAAAALEYNRSGWHRTHEDETYYYPIYEKDGETMHKGKFCSSKMSNMIPPNMTQYEADFAYEGFGPCQATTPLGQAIGCPIESKYCEDFDNDGISNARCDLVYMGHNLLGTELHWLPTDYLAEWWKSTEWYTGKDDKMLQAIQQRHDSSDSCSQGPYAYRQFKSQYSKCFHPRERVADALARDVIGSNYNLQWAKVMASLPTLRVTVMREPFSWFTSKFFWHSRFYSRNGDLVRGHIDENKDNKRAQIDVKENKPSPRVIKCDDIDEMAYGWASMRAITYILYLCGEHCMAGINDGTLTIDDMEKQAAYNLRNSFAVVGILQKTDDFYDMVTKRVYYMDTYLNPDVEGKQHSSGDYEEALRCKALYKDPDFQKKVMDKSPAVAALVRLYKIAVEVNEFQAKELAQCPLLNDSSGSSTITKTE